MVVKDMDTVNQIETYARRHKLDIPQPLTVEEFVSGEFYGRGIKGFVIDDIEFLLKYLARGVDIKAISLTKE
jgi:hypothetical protein